MGNKFTATWASHSSIGDFLKCPKGYYYKNVYKTSAKKKISIASPHLSLGCAVHDVLEPLAWLPKDNRLDVDHHKEFLSCFDSFRGKKGGFETVEEEKEFESRGLKMLDNVWENPGPINKMAVRLLEDRKELPWMWLSEQDELILTAKLDWIEFTDNGLVIIDFKTGKSTEADNSLQLPIYSIIINHFKKTKACGAAYWYLRDKELIYKTLPDLSESREKIIKVAMAMKETRKRQIFECPYGGCRNCTPYEKILNGEGELMGTGNFGQEIYYLPK